MRAGDSLRAECSRLLECSSFDILTSFKSPSQSVVGSHTLDGECSTDSEQAGRGEGRSPER